MGNVRIIGGVRVLMATKPKRVMVGYDIEHSMSGSFARSAAGGTAWFWIFAYGQIDLLPCHQGVQMGEVFGCWGLPSSGSNACARGAAGADRRSEILEFELEIAQLRCASGGEYDLDKLFLIASAWWYASAPSARQNRNSSRQREIIDEDSGFIYCLGNHCRNFMLF